MTDPLLRIEDLHTQFDTDRGIVHAVDGVSFTVDRGEIVGIVGESGSGKSVTARSILRLEEPGRIASGTITLDGEDLTAADDSTLRRVRGDRVSMVFQDPAETLNPVFPVGEQIAEAVRIHETGQSQRLLDFLGVPLFRDRASWRDAHERAVELMDQLDIPNPEHQSSGFPHEFSGGIRQRAVLAIALASDPDLLVADEPTTALDTTTQAGILRRLRTLRDERNLGVLLISHDIGVIAQTCDRVVVMYGGKVMESGTVEDVLTTPEHPYTRALLACSTRNVASDERVNALEGRPPNAIGGHDGCPFADRCTHVTPECREGDVPMTESESGHLVACVEAPREDNAGVASPETNRPKIAPNSGESQ
ncbi:ABC transporter ATP-binding protein (plasmid) [Haloferax mediterranei ATCC 33500]|uniref:Nickel import system ATP-binding protein NikD n=1 Tax=Haloferax mediterranei (strain ATCC 33500 / DSM 1411 / JCM 8866 / NBRC 14739 / NCIMB 2177 / R-4) TaxID=523841 RepID=I3RA41_HALMT|nr:ABC transporter ATP-binding protein [Haloferax mediterranei]AFK21101.1 dipeptide/oligopeptide/nickel ABC transporter ATP-binding protein [Haloferax mediterranei ATCC 33500]AHZ24311.1 ABC transporter ATP-binding protein [Haloferax mediterranei ATCC 33500]EMA05397.1 dipeptide/oligopeptide/nickel ABC transporter ATP-binding protein [Haloferax mediterranei ATCC 33500]MDX5989805.1 ABC transporter ATP-binding protein [Haloferax mediterranei ATCC 33500]QCQ77248.1 ABC transporter ATP-binding protei